MSDDFDKDDLSWLRGQEDNDRPDDQDAPDWQRDSGEQARSDAGLGFTNELPWMQEESGEPGSSASSGLTGELPWMQSQQPTPADEDDLAWLSDEEGEPPVTADEVVDDDAALDWMTEPEDFDELDEFEVAVPIEEDSLSASRPQTPSPELPDWLKEAAPRTLAANQPSTDEPETGDDFPDWLSAPDVVDLDAENAGPAAQAEPETPDWLAKASAQQAQEPAVDAMDVPDWLMGIEDEIVGAGAGESTLGDRPSDEWLAQGELLPETPSADMTFDQWMTRQAEAEQPPDPDKEVPLNFGVGDEETAEPLEAGTGELPSWFLGMEELDQTEAPDWFAAEEAAPTPQALEEDAFPDWLVDGGPEAPAAAAIDEDLFTELTFDELPGDEFIPAQPQAADQPEPVEMSVDDYLASLGSQQAEAIEDDWLAAFEEPAAPTAESGWLEELGDIQDLPAAEAEPADLSFMDEPDFDLELPPVQPAAARQDIDSILASLDAGDAQLPMTADLLSQEVDFDSLLADPAFSEIERETPRPGDDVIQGDSLDFLTELGAAVSATSAAAIVRQRQDRSLDDLPDRLQKLRARSDEAIVPPPKGNTAPLSELLPGVSGTLIPAPVEIDSPGLAAGITISPEQQRRIDLLKSLAITEQPSAGAGTPSAIDLTYDTPALTDDEALQDFELEEGAATVVAAAPRIRARRKFDRVIFALLLAAAVIAPFFVPQLRIGSLPPAEFAADSRQRRMFDSIASLQPGDLVLVAVEYGPTAAGELDGALKVLLQHILVQRAQPVLLGGSPLGLLRANAMLDDLGRVDSLLLARIGRSTPFRANEDYFVVRYLSGGFVGLRALGEDPAPLLANDYQGQPTNLSLQSIDDFALVLVVAERAEDVRLWAEQIGALTGAPLLAAVGYAAEPMSEPYLGSGIDGLLVGYGDAFTYSGMLSTGSSVPIQQTTETPPPISAPIEATEEATVAAPVDETATLAPPTQTPEPAASATAAPPTATQESTNTPVPPTATVAASASPIPPSATIQPSETTVPTAGPTNTVQPSNTPQPTNTATASPTTLATIITARVIASDRVNVRSEPTRASQPLTSLAPGETVPVIGRNGDGSWIQVRLPDGREGWVSAPLLEITAQTADQSTPTATQASALIVVMADSDMSLFRRPLISQVETTPEAEIESTAEPRPQPTNEGAAEAANAEAAAPVITESRLETTPYAEERWYGMTFGLAAAILIITLGALANIVRSILRRGRR